MRGKDSDRCLDRDHRIAAVLSAMHLTNQGKGLAAGHGRPRNMVRTVPVAAGIKQHLRTAGSAPAPATSSGLSTSANRADNFASRMGGESPSTHSRPDHHATALSPHDVRSIASMTPPYAYDVFLSHSSADKDIVRAVAAKLRDAGLRVWFDEWEIGIGDDIYLSIEAGLETSRVLALFVSWNALGSDWVDLERSTALFRDPRNRTRRFVPIRIDDVKLPDTLARYKHIDLRERMPSGIDLLIEACREHRQEGPEGQRSGVLVTYRQAHAAKYDGLTAGRRLVSVAARAGSGPAIDARAAIDAWIRDPQASDLVLVGDPGSGKTYLLRGLCARLSESNEFIPIFIPARDLQHLRPASRQELLAVADPPVPTDEILELANLMIVIDGLDELIGPTGDNQANYAETLTAVGRLLPIGARLVYSCRSTTFEATSEVVTEALRPKGLTPKSGDSTDDAIRAALRRNSVPRRMELIELSREDARRYLLEAAGADSKENPAIDYVLDNLPRVPVILRFLQLALPELHSVIGRTDLDELYAAAIRTLLLRDRLFTNDDLDDAWEVLKRCASTGRRPASDDSNRFVHAGLLTRTPSGDYAWSHSSIEEFFLSLSLFDDLRRFDSSTIARLDLIGSYNVNRFLVPRCRRALTGTGENGRARPVTNDEYRTFLKATGWRRTTGYGWHPTYIAEDGTGSTSGTDGLVPEQSAGPDLRSQQNLVSGLSWYDAFVYCLWSGRRLPDSGDTVPDVPQLRGAWVWCADWCDERKAHVSVIASRPAGTPRRGGVNPDVRHSRIGLVAVHSEPRRSDI